MPIFGSAGKGADSAGVVAVAAAAGVFEAMVFAEALCASAGLTGAETDCALRERPERIKEPIIVSAQEQYVFELDDFMKSVYSFVGVDPTSVQRYSSMLIGQVTTQSLFF
ncbi:MAG: hypothetical protein U0Z53_08040 [Blastocatellia bacterium]